MADGNASILILILLIISQVMLYTMAFTIYFKIKDRTGPPGRGTCPYD